MRTIIMNKEALLIELFGTSSIQSIELLVKEKDDEVRAKAYWALATFTEKATFNQVKYELHSTESDLARIYLASALYQLDSDQYSKEMLFLSEYYLLHYFDEDKEELKVDFTDILGRSAIIIGLILWEVGYEFFSVNNLATYKVEWLILKAEDFK